MEASSDSLEGAGGRDPEWVSLMDEQQVVARLRGRQSWFLGVAMYYLPSGWIIVELSPVTPELPKPQVVCSDEPKANTWLRPSILIPL